MDQSRIDQARHHIVMFGIPLCCIFILPYLINQSLGQISAVPHDGEIAIPFGELPRNEWGEIIVDAIPGLRPERLASPEGIDAAAGLGTIRDQILDTQPLDEWVIAIPDLPGVKGGPLPIDSDHPDPERTSRDSASSELPSPALVSPPQE